MEANMIELLRELVTKSEELGRLRAESELKDRVIAGLTAQLGVTSIMPQSMVVSSPCNCEHTVESKDIEIQPVEDVKVISEVEEKEPEVKRKHGRPKGSKNLKKSSSKVEPEKTLSGGSVFKDFVPLNIDNLVETNSNAYLLAEKKPTFVL